MEKRIGVIAILVEDLSQAPAINAILSDHSDIALGRLGLPLREKGVHVISLVVEGTTDEIGALTGKIGKVERVSVKSLVTRFKEDENE